MLINVLIPASLRRQTDGAESVAITGDSVRQVLVGLVEMYPDLGRRLFSRPDEVTRFVNVYVNDEDIRFRQNLNTSLETGDEVSIVPAIAGG